MLAPLVTLGLCGLLSTAAHGGAGDGRRASAKPPRPCPCDDPSLCGGDGLLHWLHLDAWRMAAPSSKTDDGEPSRATVVPSSNWTAYPGKVFTSLDCHDIHNIVNASVSSCQATCDATKTCTAINIAVSARDGRGACALRACPCGVALVPNNTLAHFTGYYRQDVDCPLPSPPSDSLLSQIFGSHMCLQRAPLQARLFGTAKPSAKVTVAMVPGKSVMAQADATGWWEVLLPPMPAGGPYNLTVSTVSADTSVEQSTTLTDVMFGDVVVCSGQSNMEEPVSLTNNHSAEFAVAGDFPWIRLAAVARDSSSTALRDLGKELVLPWSRASPAALGQNNSESWDFFSATCWYTARNLAKELGPGVPLGLVGSYVGGTPIAAWTPPRGVLYNSMIAPLTHMTLKFILWYQVRSPPRSVG